MSELPVILQVEDREEDVFLLSRALKRAQLAANVKVASDGQQAVDYLSGVGKYANRQEYPLPYLVLLDLKLPHLMGLDVLAWIRARPEYQSLIVIVLSSSIHDEDVRKAYELGTNAFLVKPSDTNTLADMCQALKHFWLTYNQPPAVPQRKPTI